MSRLSARNHYAIAELLKRIEKLEAALGQQPTKPKPVPKPAPREVRALCKVAGIPVELIERGRRFRYLSPVKTAACHMLKRKGWTLVQTAHAIGSEDHTTVLYHLRKPAPAKLIAEAERLLDSA